MTAQLVERIVDVAAPHVRSLTGDGVRATLHDVRAELPIEIVEVPTGTPIFDWEVPLEWKVRGARLVAPDGSIVADVAVNPLHLVSYSEPVHATVPLDELKGHLHSLPDRPSLIPYRTSYWQRTWGFCLTDDARRALLPGDYRVDIDTELVPGSLSYGELVIPGDTSDEIVLTTHICHPAMVNDNLSGIAALTELGRRFLAGPRLRHTVRLLYLPGTVGALCWLAAHRDTVPSIRGGLAMTGLGDTSPLTYKSSRRGATAWDRCARRVIRAHDAGARLLDWDPYGYDERQFCSPAFDLPFGRLTRGVHGTYPEYHTSADDRSFVAVDRIVAAIDAMEDLVRSFDSREPLVNLAGTGEPQLGRRGLYRSTGGAINGKSIEMAYLWLLSLADGDHDRADVVEASGLDEAAVDEAIARLRDCGLLGAH